MTDGESDEGNGEIDLNGSSHSSDHESTDNNGANLSPDGEILQAKQELAEVNDRYLRLLADFENFKKRTVKERSELLRYQGEQIFVDMLDVLDNLELALGHSGAEYEKLRAGLEMIHKMFVDKLAKWEVKPESGIGQEFKPEKHSAISQVQNPDAKPGTIVGELKKAYHYKDKLIRHGEVVVSS